VLLGASSLLAAPRSSADTRLEESATAHRPTRSFNLSLSMMVEPPLDIGLKLKLELPGRLFLATTLGYMPSSFVQGINRAIIAYGGYNEQTGDLVRAGLSSSLIFRAQLGWRPFPRRGFYLAAGYGFVALDADVSGNKIVAAIGAQLPPELQGTDLLRGYAVRSTLHMIHAELGWRWLAWNDRFEIGLALGFAGTLGASTEVTPTFVPTMPVPVGQYTKLAASTLDALYKSYVFTPVMTVSFGYRFF